RGVGELLELSGGRPGRRVLDVSRSEPDRDWFVFRCVSRSHPGRDRQRPRSAPPARWVCAGTPGCAGVRRCQQPVAAGLPQGVSIVGNLNFDDIQGNILRGYNFGAGSHYFVNVRDGMRGRALLRTLLPEITTARTWSTPPVIALNVALTYAGL